jgi:hypothetical protein
LQSSQVLRNNYAMKEDQPINDNRYLEYGALDPDRHYVRDYLKKAVEHFRDCKIHPETINDALTDEMVKLLSGDPGRDPVDENELWSNLHLLWPVRKRVAILIEQNMEGLRRAARQRAERSEKP